MSLIEAPANLIPGRPLGRWILGLVAFGVMAVALEAGFEAIWGDVGEVTSSREPRWIKLVAIGLGLLISVGALVIVFFLWPRS